VIDRRSSKETRPVLIVILFACELGNGILRSTMKIRARAEPMVEAVEGFERVVETDGVSRGLHSALAPTASSQVKPEEATSPQDRLGASF
jgi:hypothetical protein